MSARSTGLIGEMYLNFGILGILVMSALGGWLARGWDRIAASHVSSPPVMLFYFCGLAVIFAQGRGFSMTLLYNMLFLYLGLCLVSVVLAWRRFPATAGPARLQLA